jgi:hypothetical protein
VTLAELQRLLHGRITGSEAGRSDDVRREVLSRGPLDAEQRVEIYARMYLQRLVDAVTEDVPFTARMLGHEAMVDRVRDYLLAHPSRSPDIGQVGRSFGPWLRQVEGLRPDLPDVAILERARSEVRTALDAPVVGADALRALPPELLPAARFVFVPGLRLVRLQHDVRALWDALEAEQEAPEPVPGPAAFAVWRQDHKVFHTRLSPGEARALAVARDGGTLEDVCGAFAGEADPAQLAFSAVLSWFTDGWVSGVGAPGAPP